MKTLQNLSWIILFIFLGACLGGAVGFSSVFGSLRYWERVDFFPYPVEKILYIDVWGFRFWVQANAGGIYELAYPCVDGPCWQKIDSLPDVLDRSGFGEHYQMRTYANCSFEHFTYPLLREARQCVGTNSPHPEGTEWTYLILADDGSLWIWRGGFFSLTPLAILIATPLYAGIGAILGLLVGLILILIRRARGIRAQRQQSSLFPL